MILVDTGVWIDYFNGISETSCHGHHRAENHRQHHCHALH